MANDIIITPVSASIQFSGSANSSIKLTVDSSGSISFIGNTGSLFGITDNLSGSLMSVNTIVGLPILEVFSDNSVNIGKYNNEAIKVQPGGLNVSLGSGSVMFVTSSGRVGIGTTNPAYKLEVVGTISASAFTGSYFGTSSYALNTLTASFALNSAAGGTTLTTASSYPITSSWSQNVISSSYALTASFALNSAAGGTTLITASSYPITSSWATNSLTASNLIATNNYTISDLTASGLRLNNSLLYTEAMTTGSLTSPDIYFSSSAQTGSDAIFRIESIAFTGSSIGLHIISSGSQLSYALSASRGDIIGTGFTGSYFGTSSWSSNSISSSYALYVPQTKAVTIQYPTANENMTLFYTISPITISSVYNILRGGTSPSIRYQISFATTRDIANPSNVFSSSVTLTNTTSSVLTLTTFQSASIPSDNLVWLTTDQCSATTTEFSLTIKY